MKFTGEAVDYKLLGEESHTHAHLLLPCPRNLSREIQTSLFSPCISGEALFSNLCFHWGYNPLRILALCRSLGNWKMHGSNKLSSVSVRPFKMKALWLAKIENLLRVVKLCSPLQPWFPFTTSLFVHWGFLLYSCKFRYSLKGMLVIFYLAFLDAVVSSLIFAPESF